VKEAEGCKKHAYGFYAEASQTGVGTGVNINPRPSPTYVLPDVPLCQRDASMIRPKSCRNSDPEISEKGMRRKN